MLEGTDKLEDKRYIFTTFKYLPLVRLKRLKKACDRLFILAHSSEKISIKLASKLHSWGDKVQWITSKSSAKETTNYQLSYALGKEHESVNKKIEFLVFSNDDEIDQVLSILRKDGRTCHRIHHKSEQNAAEDIEEPVLMISPLDSSPMAESVMKGGRDTREKVEPNRLFRPGQPGYDSVLQSAKATRVRLNSMGERPENLETLKHYIHLSSNEFPGQKASIDQVLEYLERQSEIKIDQGVVKYNF